MVGTADDGTKVTFVRCIDRAFYCEPCKMVLIGEATSVHQHARKRKLLRCVQGSEGVKE